MSEIFFNYGKILNKSMQRVLRLILSYVAKNGMPAEHRFIITFLTNVEGLIIPQYLKDQYPKKMSIILEHEIYNLDVKENGFFVELSFSGQIEELFIPFDSLVEFSDPYAKFSIQFSLNSISSEMDECDFDFKGDSDDKEEDKELISELLDKDLLDQDFLDNNLFIAGSDFEDDGNSLQEKEKNSHKKCNIVCIDDLDE